jgi:hypothetical protein
MSGFRLISQLALAFLVLGPGLLAQGPGSCGIHLDILATGTSTHASIADVPGAPGASGGIAPGAVGNPYCAWAPAFSTIRLRLTVAPSALGGSPFGPNSIISLFWGVGTPNVPMAPPPGAIPTCQGGNWIVSVLPFGGALVDGLGVLGPPPLLIPVDPGHPDKFEMTLLYPFISAPPINLQAAIVTPGGALAVSNGASIMSGTNPHESDLLPSMTQASQCPFSALDEGGASITMPPGFSFYGTSTASGIAKANGFIAFGTNAHVECDYVPGASSLGCLPTTAATAPRIAVNFFDADLSLLASPARPPGLTVEHAPQTIDTPSRTIVRWKHACPWFGSPGVLAEWASATCEIWGGDVPGGSPAVGSTIIIVRQEHHVVSTDFVHGFLGIGPGDFGQGFGGPATNCVSLANWAHYGGFQHGAAPFEALYLGQWGGGTTTDSILLSNLATTYVPGLAGAYALYVY